jgi:predicted PurR-regulated permease PerM
MLGDSNQNRSVTAHSVDILVTLALVSLFAFLSFRILSPFLSILIWAAILAIALHPVFVVLKARLWGNGRWSATILALIGLMLILGPATLAVDSAIRTISPMATKLQSGDIAVPSPSEAVKDWPLIGDWAFNKWSGASESLEKTAIHFAPQIKSLATSLIGMSSGLAVGILQFSLSMIFAAVFLSYSAPLVVASNNLAERIANKRGRLFVEMIGATIRNVARGIIGVAIIQGGLASVGIIAVGLPFAGAVAIICVVACIVQAPFLVIVPTIIYVWNAEPTVTAAIYTAFMVPVLLSDNFLKPILMAQGLETPMAVILIGVIGGTLTSGLLGLFMGPVVLAVFYKMVVIWLSANDETAAEAVSDTR